MSCGKGRNDALKVKKGAVGSARWRGSEMLKFIRKTLQKSVCRVGIVVGKGK